MITSVTVMLELPNFGHMTTFKLLFESRNKIGLVTSWAKIMTSQPFLKNIFVLRNPGVAIFADIAKILTIFLKATFKDSTKVRRIINYVSKSNLYLYFLIQQNLSISGKNPDVSRTQGVYHVIHIIFGTSLGKV